MKMNKKLHVEIISHSIYWADLELVENALYHPFMGNRTNAFNCIEPYRSRGNYFRYFPSYFGTQKIKYFNVVFLLKSLKN